MKKINTIYFDMDGTIADLYGQENWLQDILTEKTDAYQNAKPLTDMKKLEKILLELQTKNVKIGIITWLGKNANQSYKNKTREAKHNWLKKHLPNLNFDEIHMVQYGTPKHLIAKDRNGILFDDDITVREKWQGIAINPEVQNILDVLYTEVA